MGGEHHINMPEHVRRVADELSAAGRRARQYGGAHTITIEPATLQTARLPRKTVKIAAANIPLMFRALSPGFGDAPPVHDLPSIPRDAQLVGVSHDLETDVVSFVFESPAFGS
jgi:hypothetical protein